MKTLVVGVVFNLPVNIILPFFSSLRKNYGGSVCIITTEVDEQLLSFYKQYNIDIHYVKDNEQMYKSRHLYIKKILETHYEDVEKIFITDVRDVYFFNNIFNYNFDSLNLFCEPKQIKDCEINKNWIIDSYNQETFECIKNEWIICNGTVLGTRDKILHYLNALIEEINNIGEKFVMDQPILNVLYYKENNLAAKLFYHHNGPIGTFCHDPDLIYRNIYENPVIVAHQYDRSKRLSEIVHNSLYFEEFQKTDKEIYQYCENKFLEDEFLVNFRTHIKENKLGFGDDAHSYMWKFLVGKISSSFKFLEIGVYKGQILCLIKLLAPSSSIFGVTPLSAVGDETTQYPEENYLKAIEELYKKFDISFSSCNIIKGLSNDIKSIQKIKAEKYFDIIYIDGGHNFKTVVSDIRLASNICKRGGYIVMDDSSYYKNFDNLNIFKGYKGVSDAVEQHLVSSSFFVERLCVGHNRIFQKIW